MYKVLQFLNIVNIVGFNKLVKTFPFGTKLEYKMYFDVTGRLTKNFNIVNIAIPEQTKSGEKNWKEHSELCKKAEFLTKTIAVTNTKQYTSNNKLVSESADLTFTPMFLVKDEYYKALSYSYNTLRLNKESKLLQADDLSEIESSLYPELVTEGG